MFFLRLRLSNYVSRDSRKLQTPNDRFQTNTNQDSSVLRNKQRRKASQIASNLKSRLQTYINQPPSHLVREQRGEAPRTASNRQKSSSNLHESPSIVSAEQPTSGSWSNIFKRAEVILEPVQIDVSRLYLPNNVEKRVNYVRIPTNRSGINANQLLYRFSSTITVGKLSNNFKRRKIAFESTRINVCLWQNISYCVTKISKSDVSGAESAGDRGRARERAVD